MANIDLATYLFWEAFPDATEEEIKKFQEYWNNRNKEEKGQPNETNNDVH